MNAEHILMVLVFGFAGLVAALLFLSAIVYTLLCIAISAAIAISQNKKER